MMGMDEAARDDLQARLAELVGPRGARALMAEMTRAVSREELREDLGALEGRMDAKLGTLEGRMDAKLGTLEGRMDAKLEALEERIDGKLEALESRMDAKLARLEARILERMNEQTKTFVRTFYVTNAAMVFAVATLAFGAARIA